MSDVLSGMTWVQNACKGYQQKPLAGKEIFNPFKLNGFAYSYQLDQSISVLRVVGCYFSFLSQF